jgi:hypothetical protein
MLSPRSNQGMEFSALRIVKWVVNVVSLLERNIRDKKKKKKA